MTLFRRSYSSLSMGVYKGSGMEDTDLEELPNSFGGATISDHCFWYCDLWGLVLNRLCLLFLALLRASLARPFALAW